MLCTALTKVGADLIYTSAADLLMARPAAVASGATIYPGDPQGLQNLLDHASRLADDSGDRTAAAEGHPSAGPRILACNLQGRSAQQLLEGLRRLRRAYSVTLLGCVTDHGHAPMADHHLTMMAMRLWGTRVA